MNKHRLKIYLGMAVLLAALIPVSVINYDKMSVPAWKPSDLLNMAEPSDHQPGYAVSITDSQGNLISMAARGVSVGDEIINSEGQRYRVSSVKGDKALADFVEMDRQFLSYNEYFSNMEVPVAVVKGWGKNLVGVYHTHSDESYVPTDGKEAIPFKGGIFQVGQALVEKLQNKKLMVNYDKTPHDPHDNNAYYRSRRTATRLMKQNPVAILDVHRDGIPNPGYYRKNISNEKVAQLRLVVGRQNPNMKANLDFAKKMMAYANKVHPKIVKEIFIAKGNYNQDLMPTALLIEAGTHTNSRQEAENGVALFADAIPTVLGIGAQAPGGPGGVGAAPGGAWKALAWILGIVIVGGGAFLLISSGGFSQAKSRISSYIGREFSGFMGPLGRPRSRKIFFGSKEGRDKNTGIENDPDKNEIDTDNYKKIR
ncbi:MAG: stage II sporulation protein P [Bacillota bacterium]